MRWASGGAGNVDARHADSSTRAWCPTCRAELLLRRGLIRAAHWAHQPGAECPQQRRRWRDQPHLFDVDPRSPHSRQRTHRPDAAAFELDGQLTFDFETGTAAAVTPDTGRPHPRRRRRRVPLRQRWSQLRSYWRRR